MNAGAQVGLLMDSVRRYVGNNAKNGHQPTAYPAALLWPNRLSDLMRAEILHVGHWS